MNTTPEQQLGALAAEALDSIRGRKLAGAVLMIALDTEDDMMATNWFVPEGQHWLITLGTVNDWLIKQTALITSSAFAAGAHEDPDEDG